MSTIFNIQKCKFYFKIKHKNLIMIVAARFSSNIDWNKLFIKYSNSTFKNNKKTRIAVLWELEELWQKITQNYVAIE